MTTKKCCDCEHAVLWLEVDGLYRCYHPDNSSVVSCHILCEKERGAEGNCGPSGKLFELPPPKPSRKWNFLKKEN